jgi:hypothetical protein
MILFIWLWQVLRIWLELKSVSLLIRVFVFVVIVHIGAIILNILLVNPLLWFAILLWTSLSESVYKNENIRIVLGDRHFGFAGCAIWAILSLFVAKAFDLLRDVEPLTFWYLHGVFTGQTLLYAIILSTRCIEKIVKAGQ